MLQEYLGDYGFKLRLLEPCCPEGKTSLSLSTSTCSLKPKLNEECNKCTSRLYENRARSSRDYCYYVDDKGNYNGFCKYDNSSCKNSAKNSDDPKFKRKCKKI